MAASILRETRREEEARGSGRGRAAQAMDATLRVVSHQAPGISLGRRCYHRSRT